MLLLREARGRNRAPSSAAHLRHPSELPTFHPFAPRRAVARATIPALRAEIYGDGPERASVIARIAASGLEGSVEAPGFVEDQVLK